MARKTVAMVKAEYDAARAAIIHECAHECSKMQVKALAQADEPGRPAVDVAFLKLAATHYKDCADTIRELLEKKE